MAILTEANSWEPGIYQLELTDPVVGGSDGLSNLQAKQLANRTSYLKSILDALVSGATAAGKATKLAVARTINGVPFDGSANITIADATKEPAIAGGTAAQYWRGTKTWADLGTDIRAALVTGLSTANNTAVVATDSILVALGKLQAQVSLKLDATASAVSATKLAVARTINGVPFDGSANITIADATKEPAIDGGTAAQFWAGTKTWVDFATNVRAAVLTGLSTATGTAVTATDSVLVAVGKLQAQATTALVQATETVLGRAKVATQALVNAGADDTTMVTPKKLRWGFSISLAENGYIAFPTWLGSLVIQWGSGSYASGASITFPITFPNQCFVVIPAANTAATAGIEVPGVASFTTSGWVTGHATAAVQVYTGWIYWFSIGY